jgi:prophage DNA circulation protein
MTIITQLASGKPWRDRWQPAMFRNARFHVETGLRESGRRLVPHEFPKRNVPYAEDMGRRAREFTVRGYIIVYPRNEDGHELRKRNYIPARDALIKALEEEGPAELQLPLLGVLKVACSRYRVTEDNKSGGFCVFDMSFVEFGQAPAEGTRDSKAGVEYAETQNNAATKAFITDGIKKVSESRESLTA